MGPVSGRRRRGIARRGLVRVVVLLRGSVISGGFDTETGTLAGRRLVACAGTRGTRQRFTGCVAESRSYAKKLPWYPPQGATLIWEPEPGDSVWLRSG
jgi:hypothetical protein